MLQSHNIDVNVSSRARADWCWAAVANRDRSADGQFVYAVTSTRVFCRPSCPSRRPRRDRVRFFGSPAAAAAAGFRACRRCNPEGVDRRDDVIARTTAYLREHADQPVSLASLATLAGLSPFHFQRRFTKAVGVSPREYQAACRAERFRLELRSGRDVTEAIYEAGYGSPSRVYAAAPTGRGMTPAAYRRGGAGAEIGFVTLRSPVGWLLIAATAKGLCAVRLGDSARELENELRREFPHASLQPGRLVPDTWQRAIVEHLSGSQPQLSLPLDVRATAFQWRVWRALQAIPRGETRTYSDVARQIGRPLAVRAVARACATNPVCAVIPCHRVIAKDGGLGGYRWGATRKERLLRNEQRRDGRAGRRRQAK